MIEEALVFLFALCAAIYVGRHMKNTLTIGEDDQKCSSCPLSKK